MRYWERGLSAWDIAAGVLLVREAGGFVTDLDGNERTMEAGDIIAGNDTMHREVLALLRSGLRGSAEPTVTVAGAALCYCRFCAIIAGDL